MNPLCSCSLETENTFHFLLHCHLFTLNRVDIMNSVKYVCHNIDSMTDNKVTFLLYCESRFVESKYKIKLQSSITYLKN